MRRTFVGALCLLLVVSWIGIGKAQVGGNIVNYREVAVLWWQADGARGTLISLYVDEYTLVGEDGQGQKLSAYLYTIPCEVGRADLPRHCDENSAWGHRVRVVTYEMDPLLESAHAVVEWKGRRGEVEWISGNDYSGPYVGQNLDEYFYPPNVDVSAEVWTSMERNASASGDLFGLELTGAEALAARMSQSNYSYVNVCTNPSYC